MNFGNNYEKAIEYAYKLLLQNQAHDSICGCSTDLVHKENITRYHKILEITDTIINEIGVTQPENMSITFKYLDKYKLLTVEKDKIDENSQVLSKRKGFPKSLLYDINKIPVTEDYTTIYTLLKEFNGTNDVTDLEIKNDMLFNSNIKIELKDGKLNLYTAGKCYENFIEFVRYKDNGDTYNFGPVENDLGEVAEIKSAKILMNGDLRSTIRVSTSFFNVDISLNKKSHLLNFKIKWLNLLTNKLWQVRFNTQEPIIKTYSEDMNLLLERKFNPEYEIRKNLPKEKGIEAMTNTAPLQRFVWANGLGIITKGLTEYEVQQDKLAITLLRSTGIISNPQNPARLTPAGPPIEVPEAQQIGENIAEFSIGFFDVREWANYVEEVYPQTVLF